MGVQHANQPFWMCNPPDFALLTLLPPFPRKQPLTQRNHPKRPATQPKSLEERRLPCNHQMVQNLTELQCLLWNWEGSCHGWSSQRSNQWLSISKINLNPCQMKDKFKTYIDKHKKVHTKYISAGFWIDRQRLKGGNQYN
ncbi:hypothetical protein VP01_90g6 [Puccinia sorghi]|uniref:Uncharacterized protein n=1 Tax=Puccinia sorghi TaxID=27349 RepID=A0A0L6U7M2_9BASI|nr:hypothetical protein VP01_90g6 [Puccinia sorghi]